MTALTRAHLAHLAETRAIPAWQIKRAWQIARATAARWHAGAEAQGIDDDDLRAEALAEAWRALLTHDPARCSLDTWLIIGCRRGVLEALRRADPLTRGERARFREARKGDPHAVCPVQVLSLSDIYHDDEEGVRLRKGWEAAVSAPDPAILALSDRLDTEALAATALAALHGRRREVALLWMAGLTLKEIAGRMRLCESRIHGLWQEAKRTMRAAILELR